MSLDYILSSGTRSGNYSFSKPTHTFIYPEKLPDASKHPLRDELKIIRADAPDLYEALAKDDPSLIV